MTQKTFFSVGRGTGPTTVAPARVTVSTILRAELSMTSWSYDLSRMRIFCPAMSDSLSLVPSASLDARCETLLLSHHCFDVNRRMFTRRHTRHPLGPGPALDARVAA